MQPFKLKVSKGVPEAWAVGELTILRLEPNALFRHRVEEKPEIQATMKKEKRR